LQSKDVFPNLERKKEMENTKHSPIQTIRLPRRRCQPLPQHHRDLRPDVGRDARPGGAWPEGEWLGGGGLEWGGKEREGGDVGGEHFLAGSHESSFDENK